MSRSAFSAQVFAVYLFILGAILVFIPNVLLTLFWLALTSEVWIRVIGLLVINIGVFAWVAARHDDRHFLAASVITRCFVFVALTAFVIFRLASPMLVVFGVLDLAGGMWTYFALKADARSAS